MAKQWLAVLTVLAVSVPTGQAQVRWKPYDLAVVVPQAACPVALSVPQDRIATERQISPGSGRDARSFSDCVVWMAAPD
jgi:hypothetical protein